MATIKVTYVVDNGNFIEVANDIKILATIRFTAALTKSNAGLSCSFTFNTDGAGFSKRALTRLCRLLGKIAEKDTDAFTDKRTI
jgi:hypothetical protein